MIHGTLEYTPAPVRALRDPPARRPALQEERWARNTIDMADRYYPKGYQPDMLPFWPSDKPIFLPESMVPEQMKQKSKQAPSK